MGFEHFKISKAGAPFRHAPKPNAGVKSVKRDEGTSDASCATGAFYASPALGTSVSFSPPSDSSTSTPLSITWRPSLSCLLPTPSLVDIYLYAPGLAQPRLHWWEGVPYSTGNYSVDVKPSWWGSVESVSLQVMVVPGGTPPFLSTIPAGPVFTATYTSTSANSTSGAAASTPNANTGADDGHTIITPSSSTSLNNSSSLNSHKLSPGKTAAAVLLPLLTVILLGAVYLKWQRAKGQKKRGEWSEKLDKRMSRISGEWRSITAGGAREGVRASIAVSRSSNAGDGRNNTASVYSVGAIQPGAVEGEPVVMGEKTRGGSIEIQEKDLPRTSLGSGVGVGVGARRPRNLTNNTPDRASRAVSFADTAHPRPSLTASVYSRQSRAFHTSSTYFGEEGEDAAPPVPALPSPSRVSAYGQGRESAYGGGGGRESAYTRGSVYTTNSAGHGSYNSGNGSYNNGTAGSGEGHNAQGGEGGNALYQHANVSAWSSGERVEGVDGGYGAAAVSPTGRVHHVVNYPATYGGSPTSPAPTYTTNVFDASAAYDTNGSYEAYPGYSNNGNGTNASYFSPTTPTPTGAFDSAYAETTYASPVEGEGRQDMTSPRQTAGPLTLTPEDIRRRMTLRTPSNGSSGNGGNGTGQQGEWRQSVNEVFGALSMMRTGTEDDDGGDGEYLFAPMPETVFAYPGTPAPGAAFNSAPAQAAPAAPATSPFAMPMPASTMSPDEMLRAYATSTASKHTSTSTPGRAGTPTGRNHTSTTGRVTPSPLSGTTAGAQVVPTLAGTGMRVLYKQPEEDSGNAGIGSSANVGNTSSMIRAGPGARLSR
ncbi:hypothetical protein C8R43DRAFT_343131 [Mycena crocata]|nr:hypothetical protein C8R43DRAFT_343131 [Mycena crocata]